MTDRDKLAGALDETVMFAPQDKMVDTLLDKLRVTGLAVVPRKATGEMLHAIAKSMSPGRRPTQARVSVAKKHAIRYAAAIAAGEVK